MMPFGKKDAGKHRMPKNDKRCTMSWTYPEDDHEHECKLVPDHAGVHVCRTSGCSATYTG
jgi:hypothetical protein